MSGNSSKSNENQFHYSDLKAWHIEREKAATDKNNNLAQ